MKRFFIQDTAVVSQAKLQHQELYNAIALRNSQVSISDLFILRDILMSQKMEFFCFVLTYKHVTHHP